MKDIIYLGPTPAEEGCVQVGSDGYLTRAREECKRFISLIRRTCGQEPEGATLKIAIEPHDFGSYLEVVVEYDTENESAIEYAFKVENDCPVRWS